MMTVVHNGNTCPAAGDGPAAADPPVGAGGPPVFYAVASKLHRLLPLSREQHLVLWRRVLDLYARTNRPLPAALRALCEEAFVNELLEDEVFWAMAGAEVSRELYARATDHLSAVYATAALMAAVQEGLALAPEDEALLAEDA
jgi:hypothetical protein